MKSQFFLLLSPLLAFVPLQMVTAAETRPEVIEHVPLFVNVTGKVLDLDGNPVIGATISIKGTTTSTQTDENGVFRLNLPQGNEILVISFVGYKTQEFPVNNQTNFEIRLEPTDRSEEHTSELQSRENIVCRLLLEK